MLEQLDPDRTRAQKAYRQFVSQGRGASPWDELKGQIYLGSDSFIASLPIAAPRMLEVPKRQRLVNRPSLSALFADDRNIDTIYQAYRDHGYTQREIAKHLGVHYATISRRIKQWEETEASQKKKC